MERNTRSKSQQEYIRTLIQGLSLQRLTDAEIVEYLHEKQIEIARTTVNRIRNTIERNAEKWYIELKQSRYRYIATYKERLDSLLSYQKILHGIIQTTKKDEVKIRAVSELSSIEMNIFSLWKQLPNLDIAQTNQPNNDANPLNEPVFGEDYRPPMIDDDDIYGTDVEPWDKPSWLQCQGCKRWWRRKEVLDYHQRKGTCGIAVASIASSSTPTPTTTEIKDNEVPLPSPEGDGEWKQFQCHACGKLFMNNFLLSCHECEKFGLPTREPPK